MSLATSEPNAPPHVLSPRISFAGRLLVALALALTALACFHSDAPFYNALLTPRRLALILIAGLELALVLWSWGLHQRFIWHWHPIDGPVLALIGAAVLCSALGPYPLISFFGTPLVQDNLPYALSFVMLYVGAKEFVRTRQETEQLLMMVIGLGCLVAIIGYADFFLGWSLNPAFSRQRLVSTLGNSMFTGTYFAMLLPLGIVAMLGASTRRQAIWLGAGLLVMAPALLFTMARAAWLGFALTMLILAGVFMWQQHSRGVRWSARFILIAVCIGLVLCGTTLLHPTVRGRVASLINLEGGTVGTRLVYMQGAWNMFKARPLVGWGIGNIQIVFPQFCPQSLLSERGLPINRGFTSAYPHNIFLHVAADMGILGLLAFSWLLIVTWRAGLRETIRNATASWLEYGLLGLLLGNVLTNLFAFDNAAPNALLWTGLGLLAGRSAVIRLSAPLRAGRTLQHLGLVVIVLVPLWVGALLYAAHSLSRYANQVSASENLTQTNRAQAWQHSQTAVAVAKQIHQLIPFEPLTYWTLMMAYRAQAMAAADEAHYTEASEAMFYWGEAGVRLMDRDSMILRMLLLEYTTNERYQEAERIGQTLLRAEPNSAEVHLQYTDLLEATGRYDLAEYHARRATILDPTSPISWLALAHFQYLQLSHNDPRGEALAHLVCTNFQRALTLREGKLSAAHRLEYATALFLSRRNAEGIQQGRLLQGKAQFGELVQKLRIIYRVYNAPDEGLRLIEALQHPE
jgi:O-antigen ligase